MEAGHRIPRKRLRLTRSLKRDVLRLFASFKRDAGLYVGFSTALGRRLREHESGATQSTNFRGPWNLIYYETYAEEADALGRERYLKSGGDRKFLRSQLRNYLGIIHCEQIGRTMHRVA
jgi:putative endonuclease